MSSRVNNQDWELLADLAEKYITSKERVSELRALYYDKMSERRWANSAFDSIVTQAVESLDAIEEQFYQNGDRDEDWMKEGIVAIIDGHFAKSVLSDDRLADTLGDAEYDGMVKAAKEYQRLTGGGRGGRERRGFGGRGDYDDRDRGHGGRGEDRSRYAARDLGRTAPSARTPRGGRGSQGAAPTASGGHWDVLSNIGNDAEPEPQRERERTEERRYVPPPVEEVIRPVQREKPRAVLDGPDFTKARPYDHFWRNGEQWELAHLTKWKLTGSTILDTIPTLYNCNEFIKYFVMDEDGNVREEFEPVTDDNRYAAHETLNRSDDQPVASKPASAGFSRAALEGNAGSELQSQYIAPKRIELADMIDLIKDDQLTVTGSQPADNITSAVFSTRAKLRAYGEESHIDLHLLRTPIVTSSFEQIQLIEEIYNTTTIAGAQLKLNELKPKFDLPVWETLNKRYTDYLLRALKYQFNYDEVTKFNFAKHYDKLLEALARDRGPEMAANFAERVGYVTDLACGHFSREDTAGYTEDLFSAENGAEVPMVCFVDFLSIAAFDRTLDQLGIGKALEQAPTGMAVSKTKHSDLYESLRKLYQNMDKALQRPAKIRVYLSTSDNRLVEVLPFANRMDAFILAAV